MQNEQGEIHVNTDEARGGSTSGAVRWVLGIGLLLAVVALGTIMFIGIGSQDESEEQVNVNRMENGTADRSDIDGVLTPQAEEASEVESQADLVEGDGVSPTRTVPN